MSIQWLKHLRIDIDLIDIYQNKNICTFNIRLLSTCLQFSKYKTKNC